MLKRHPDVNHSGVPWATSEKGLAAAAKGLTELNNKALINGSPWQPESTGKSVVSYIDTDVIKLINAVHTLEYKNVNLIRKEANIPFLLSTHNRWSTERHRQGGRKAQIVGAEALIDTGSNVDLIDANFLSVLRNKHACDFDIQPNEETLGTAFSNAPTFLSKNCICNLIIRIFDEQSTRLTYIVLGKVIITESEHPLIIGLPSIIAHNLLNRVSAQMMEGLDPANIRQSYDKTFKIRSDRPKYLIRNVTTDIHNDEICTYVTSSKESLLTPEEDEEAYMGELPNALEVQYGDIDPKGYLEVKIEGPHELVEQGRSLCYQYRNIISDTLPETPANVTPMTLKVDSAAWFQRSNQTPPRVQSPNKHDEIARQIIKMVGVLVIMASIATAWSQVLLTPKPNGKWRFCLDFRKLNAATQPEYWPLPKIQEILQRLGAKKYKFFAKLDLTNGYHQMPLAEDSRHYTAFATSQGLYEWKRVPMGLRNAAGHFQRIMTGEVLVGLIGDVCEVYIDDIIVGGRTAAELMENLKKVFEALRKKGIVVSPSKCQIGLTEIEVLGHLINEHGFTFSKEKLAGVHDIPLPRTGKELLSFLGLCNYFRTHVHNYAQLEAPLRTLASVYKDKQSKQAISWTDELQQTFVNLRKAVWECPTLFFQKEDMPIHLKTDACNTGIGAYLYQQDSAGNQYPLGFMSKALKGPQLNWSTFEQEGYAILMALSKFEYLLRDVQFTLHTDHRNLLYLNEKASPKVQRWKNAIQQYNFEVRHIKGVDNNEADLFSRIPRIDDNEASACTPATEPALSQPREGSSATSARTSAVNVITTRSRINFDERAAIMATADAGEPNIRDVPLEIEIDNDVPLLELSIQEKRDLLKRFHGSLSGHHGINRTVNMLRSAGHNWLYMRGDVHKFVSQCGVCQVVNPIHSVISTPKFTTSTTAPMQRVAADTIVDLLPTEDGYLHCLVIVDMFTRWVELYPLKTLTAAETRHAFNNYFCRFGAPAEVLTDNHGQFENHLLAKYFKESFTFHPTIAAYSHEENGIVERLNRELEKHLRPFQLDEHNYAHWNKHLPFVQRIHNSAVHSAIGVTPAQLLYGTAVQLDSGILLAPTKYNGQTNTIREYADTMIAAQNRSLAFARVTQLAAQKAHLQPDENVQQVYTHFNDGEYVLLAPPENRRPHTLARFNSGPYRVINHDEKNRYSLYDFASGRERTNVIVHRLRPFLYDPEHDDPQSLAEINAQLYRIERIVSHDVNCKRNNNRQYSREHLTFVVKWMNFPESANTVESYHDLRNTEQLHEYLRKAQPRLTYLIPSAFRQPQDNLGVY